MSAVQIVLLVFIGIFAVLSIGFMVAFIVELAKTPKEDKQEESQEVKSVFEVNINETVTVEEEKKDEVSEMLADLDKLTEGEEVEEEKKEESSEETKTEEAKEVPAEPEAEETKEETSAEVISLDLASEESSESVEEKAEETKVEETKAEESQEVKAEVLDGELDAEIAKHEPITPGSLIDYETRLEKVKANRSKIVKDLEKNEKSILKYERTIRRKDRNQRMLDRRAGELTNLNLLMYSVTDIKNVDEDKKVKQEELTAHIAELKASIQDAEEYIESNQAKHAQEKSMVKYLEKEKARYDEEIAELEALIKSLTEGTEA